MHFTTIKLRLPWLQSNGMVVLAQLAAVLLCGVANGDKPEDFFEKEIWPILQSRCISCHGPEKQEGSLRLDSRDAVLRGGDRGPAVVGDNPEASLILQAIGYRDDDLRMPPKGKLPHEELDRLSRWIADGLAWEEVEPPPAVATTRREITLQDREHWAFRPLKLPPASPPDSVERSGGQRPGSIDAYLGAELQRHHLEFAPEADRAMLLRRVSFDLIGLPPTHEELRAFLSDEDPDAYERLLDRLLASPHFGERWGRHWLDNAGYVDVQGLDNDAATVSTMENKWLYRDYVVASFNDDKPFDRFLREQLAGDESFDWRQAESYSPEQQAALIATGFLRTAADDTSANELNRRDVQFGVLERTQEALVNNLLALTIQCAKCHDHKYEPLLQSDYYRLQALLQPALNPDRWLQPAQRQLPSVPPPAKERIDQHNGAIEQQIAQIMAEASLSSSTPAEPTGPPEAPLSASEPVEDAASAERETKIRSLQSQKQTYQHWQVVYDVGPPTATRLLKRGNPLTPGEEVAPGLPAVLVAENSQVAIPDASPSSGRRTALAQALTNPDSPVGSLVLRVRVNRIWQQLFGRGLVASTDNFGVTGEPPSHPELLEWLAQALVADGQRLKPFLKRIMMSAAYRQTSIRSDEAAQSLDPENRLLWKQRLRRLESESIRDALLAASGSLDCTLGGPPIPVIAEADGSFKIQEPDEPGPGTHRRSLYLLARRNYHPTLLSVFDQPNLATTCVERRSSAVVLQSLTMLNDPFVVRQAKAIATRINQETEDRQERLKRAFELLLGRSPVDVELAWCEAAFERELALRRSANEAISASEAEQRALATLCHALMNTSEFLMIP